MLSLTPPSYVEMASLQHSKCIFKGTPIDVCEMNVSEWLISDYLYNFLTLDLNILPMLKMNKYS